MKKLLLLVLLMMPLSANAECGEQVNISVNGLVCDFCAQALNKVFRKQDAVYDINVDLDNHLVTVYLKNGATMEDDAINQLILDSGYNTVGLERQEC